MAERRQRIVITGGNTGIGFEAAKQLLTTGKYDVTLLCRDSRRAEEAVASLRKLVPDAGEGSLEWAPLDLASLAAVRSSAEQLLQQRPVIDVLLCNAGLLALGASVPKHTVDGYDSTLQVNHLGHFLLVHLLLPALLAAPSARLVVVSSELHRSPKGPQAMAAGGKAARAISASPDWLPALREGAPKPPRAGDGTPLKPDSPAPMQLYSLSKLYNLWFTAKLAKLLPPNVTPVAVSPGWVPATGLSRGTPWILNWIFKGLVRFFDAAVSPEEGAGRVVAACVGTEEGTVRGAYYSARKRVEGSPESQDTGCQERLWSLSEEAVGIKGVPYVPGTSGSTAGVAASGSA